MAISSGIRKDKNATISALFGVAAIQGVVGLLGWFIYYGQLGWLDRIICLSGAIYLVLAVSARWLPRFAALFGSAIYAAFLLLQVSQSIDLLMTGLIFKIPIVILLLVAVISSHKRSTAAPSALQPA